MSADQQVDQAATGNPQPGFPSMDQQPVVTAVSESPASANVSATVEVSAPAPQPAVAEQRIEPVMQRQEPKAQAFVAERRHQRRFWHPSLPLSRSQ